MHNLRYFLNKSKEIIEKNHRINSFNLTKENFDKKSLINSSDFKQSIIYKDIISKKICILNYKKSVKDDKYCFSIKEIFYCQYKDWLFEIEYINDKHNFIYIENLRNKLTEEYINYKFDFLSNELNLAMEIMNFGKESFIKKHYNKILKIPEILLKKGFKIDITKFKINTLKHKNFIKINDRIYLVVNLNGIDFDIYFSNKEMNNLDLDEKIYMLKLSDIYSDEEYLYNEYIHYINILDGKYGYYENEYYYKNEDVKKLYNYIYNLVNEIKIDTTSISLINEETYHKCDENFSRGIEINYKFSLYFNQICNEYYDEKYSFLILYDKSLNKDKCMLKINCSIYKTVNGNSSDVYLDEDYEQLGTFTEIASILKTFLINLLEIHSKNK